MLHEHPSRVYLLICNWKTLRDSGSDVDRTLIQCHARNNFFSFSGTNYYDKGLIDLCAKISLIAFGKIFFLTLNISVARAFTFL